MKHQVELFFGHNRGRNSLAKENKAGVTFGC